MGNHDAGRAMVNTALALLDASQDMEPMKILDVACEPWRGADAEFDDEMFWDRPFGQLIQKAFEPPGFDFDPTRVTPEGFRVDEDMWFDQIYEPFRKRYNLC